ncbi:2OG-Fe(II) oxygenase [Rufibacter sp. DG15C]|uniref:alpha-ketoglutarate-dependent dioxygenase AlkB family protein n=1 Tax=Rufibacter sp. DG15C TaxID=1379909 RepID=UPI00078D9925|nr:alpha-ketoglutarate-dependent dioxygenase AlkB [Rufibacter sp. DG15C]AMM51116.1 2OG-Fe(II) oxygenase [Rufibacter sp. DG15C]
MPLSPEFTSQFADQLLSMPGAEVYLLPEFIPVEEQLVLWRALEQEVAWRQEEIKLFGKSIPQPRLTAWYGDEGKSYTYSGLTWQPLPWLPILSQLREKLLETTGISFNSVLLNLYRNGQDSMGWHADDEPELGKNPVIASISLGQERSFHFRHRTQTGLKEKLLLSSGSLLLMAGETQHHWQHQVPKSAKPLEPRINLTFRVIH